MHIRFRSFVLNALFASCFFGILSFYQITDARPVAFIKNTSYDFGTVIEGAEVVYDYVVKNRGDSELEILSIKSL